MGALVNLSSMAVQHVADAVWCVDMRPNQVADATDTLSLGMFSAKLPCAFLRRLVSVAPMFEPFPQRIQTASR
jgi:hypothetical protein